MLFGAQPREKPNNELRDALSGVPPEYQEELKQIIMRHSKVFMKATLPLTTTASTFHLELTTNTPVIRKPYRYSEGKLKIIEEVRMMKGKGYLEPGDTLYNSPIVVVQKKDGSPRFCIDYRKLNNITINEPTPQLNLHDSLKNVG